MINVGFGFFKKKLKCMSGFTVIESLIAVTLVMVICLSCMGMISFFARCTKQDTLNTCLLQAASSGIEAVRADTSTTLIKVSCGGYTANVSITSLGTLPQTAPAMGLETKACVEITSTSEIEGKKMVIKDFICNFPKG